MSWLYSITIYPLELIFKYVYLMCTSLTGSYGFGLIVLSLCYAVVYMPLSRMAAAAQNKERVLQDVLKPQIDKINADYSGATRHDAIARLYKRYGYHPIMSIRSAFGVMLQIPFLMAAYYMVSGLTILQGQSFWFIKDLSKPDGLLNGINLLPIVMTLINFATTFTSSNMRSKDRVQAIVIALLFLWMLYNAPSALLFYWTCNNVIYLIQNLLTLMKSSNKTIVKWQTKIQLSEKGLKIADIVFASAFAIVIFVGIIPFRNVLAALSSNDIAGSVRWTYWSMLVPGIILTLLFVRQQLRNSFSLQECTTKIFFAAISFLIIILFMKTYMFPVGITNLNVGKFLLLSIWVAVLSYLLLTLIFSVSYPDLQGRLERALEGNASRLYAGSMGVVAILLFIFCESDLYKSDPSFFPKSLLSTLAPLVTYAIGFVVLCTILWFVLSKGLKKIIAVLSLFAVICILLNIFVFTIDYGALDNVVFSKQDALYDVKTNLTKDILTAAIGGVLTWFILAHQHCRKAIQALYIIGLSLLLFSGYVVLAPSAAHSTKNQQSAELLPEYHDRLWGFSKEGKNVIVFVWDMFTGGHMQEILAEYPQLKAQLDGFVWYPDTVAVGSNTFMSMPSIYGGEAYTPINMNKDGERPLIDKLHEAYAVMPNAFLKEGYDVVAAGLPYAIQDLYKKYINSDKALIFVSKFWGETYVDYWRKWAEDEQLAIDNKNNKLDSYILALALFRALPASLRPYIYDNGKWHGIAEQVTAVSAEQIIKHLAPLQFMDRFSNAKNKNNTFKIFYSYLSHQLWHLPKDSLIPVEDPCPRTDGQFILIDGILPEHMYTECHMMKFLVQFCEWLKKEGIYDNTRIIVVSDHCEGDSKMLNSAFGVHEKGYTKYGKNKAYPGRPHALMLIKDFNSSGNLSISDAYVSTKDTPSFALMDLTKVEHIPDRSKLFKELSDSQRVRGHIEGAWNPQSHNKNTMIIDGHNIISGTMFKKENWGLKND